MAQITLKISDLACAGCVDLVNAAIQALDPEAVVTADLTTKQVTITSQIPEPKLFAAIRQAGYTPELVP